MLRKLFGILVCLGGFLALGLFVGFGIGNPGSVQAKALDEASTWAASGREAGWRWSQDDQLLERTEDLFIGAAQGTTITPTIVFSFTVPGNRALSLAWGDGSLWLADVDNNVYRLDSNGVVQTSFPITVTAYGLAWHENSLWAHDGNKVYQLDSTGQVSNTLNVGYWWNGSLEWVENDFYVTDYNFGEVHKLDQLGNHILSWLLGFPFFGHPTGMTYDGTGLWIGDSCEGGRNNLYRYSLLGNLLDIIDLDLVGIPCNVSTQSTRGLAWDGLYLWSTADDLFTVYKLDIGTAPPPPPPGSTFAKVIDENGQPIEGAQVYRNGNLVTGTTNIAGVLILDDVAQDGINDVQVGDTLVAVLQEMEQPTIRAAHDGWAYRIYKTSLPVDTQGNAQPYTVITPTEAQTLTIKPNNTLILFNLVVSIEWDAEDEYIGEIARAVQSASDYLYDLTDGQMAFERVAIYDNAEHWADADIQISTKNIVRPHAYIGGIVSNDKSHVIRLGRFWDGDSGNQGSWDQPDGSRTLAHEFGHYALHLYDEYLYFIFDQNNNVVDTKPAYCTTPHQLMDPNKDPINASAMYYQYITSELSARNVTGMWSSSCEQTAQWQMTERQFGQGESAWETLARVYNDTVSPPRWQITTPLDRGSILAGPTSLPPDILALPQVIINNSGAAVQTSQLKVLDQDGEPYWGAIVALYKLDGRVIGQGFTDSNGHLDIFGAEEGDILRASSFDGGLAGSVTIGVEMNITLNLAPVAGLTTQAADQIPHMQVRAEPSQDPSQIDLLVSLRNFGPGADPGLIVTVPGSQAGFAPTLSYSPATDTYEGDISFSATERGMGRIRAVGAVGNNLVRLQSTYRLQRVFDDQGQDIYSDDGNLGMHLEPGSLPGDEAYFVVMPPGAVPGPPPPGLVLVGDPYDVTVSGALVTLQKPAILTMHYDGSLTGSATAPEGLSIYRWDPNSQSWQEIGGDLDEEQGAIMAPVNLLGIYALMAPDGDWTDPTSTETFLPVILKDSPTK